MQILDPVYIFDEEPVDDDFSTYGLHEFGELAAHYGHTHEPDAIEGGSQPPIDSKEIEVEWSLLKQQLVFHNSQYKDMNIQEFWKVIKLKHSHVYPQLLKLASICLCLPLSTAACERGFSTQNRIKTKLRNRLTSKRLDVLMRISMEGPPIHDFDFSKALNIWKVKKQRRIFQ